MKELGLYKLTANTEKKIKPCDRATKQLSREVSEADGIPYKTNKTPRTKASFLLIKIGTVKHPHGSVG